MLVTDLFETFHLVFITVTNNSIKFNPHYREDLMWSLTVITSSRKWTKFRSWSTIRNWIWSILLKEIPLLGAVGLCRWWRSLVRGPWPCRLECRIPMNGLSWINARCLGNTGRAFRKLSLIPASGALQGRSKYFPRFTSNRKRLTGSQKRKLRRQALRENEACSGTISLQSPVARGVTPKRRKCSKDTGKAPTRSEWHLPSPTVEGWGPHHRAASETC